MSEPRLFKPVNIATSDWDDYDRIAKKLSKQLGVPIRIPALIRKAVTRLEETLDEE